MLNKFYAWLRSLFNHEPVRLAIVRRYQDANGHNVGELYLETVQYGVSTYNMIGVSLDSFHIDLVGLCNGTSDWLDTEHDFLAPMPVDTVRVGALDPKANDSVRRMVGRLPKRDIRVTIQNRFIGYVLGDRA